VSATGTTTLGFIVWTLAISAVGWGATVAARWHELAVLGTDHPFNQALRDSLRAGGFLTLGVAGLVLISYSAFLIRTVYEDHRLLVAKTQVVTNTNLELIKELELRKHSMVTTDPVFVNTIYLLQAFNVFQAYSERASRTCPPAQRTAREQRA